MKTYKLMIMGVLGLLAWFAMGVDLARAQGEVLFPVDANGTALPNQAVTISILDPNGDDITGTWLPKPEQEFLIRVNEANEVPPVTVTLIFDQATAFDPLENAYLTTSGYPGVCTNFGDPEDLTADFTLPQPVGANIYSMISLDSGGMAVVRVTGTDISGATFDNYYVIPADSDFDGIADTYEKQFCQDLICLDPGEDDDIGPEPESAMGDGIAARDEYRGFKASGGYLRTDPRVKDLFVNLVTEPAGGDQVNLNTFFGQDLALLFDNMDNFSTGLKVHQITSAEWIDHFDYYSPLDGLQLMSGADAATDRQITPNALVPPLGNPAKGIRLIECLDLNQYSPLGLTIKKAPPDGLEKEYGNAIIFTQRIWESYKSKFILGDGRNLKYYTFENGSWTEKIAFQEGTPVNPELLLEHEGVALIMQKALAFYAAHEGCGHPLDLTPTQEGTKKNPVGYHHVTGTGTNIDIKIEHKVDRKMADYNKFYIPKSFGVSDKRDMRILSNQ